MARRIAVFVAAVAVLAVLPGAAGATETCAPADHPGGEWRSYGQDHRNSRTQPAETQIGPDQAADLAPRTVFSAALAGGEGNFNSTPVVADGCLYVATDLGYLYALNADTFKIVWSKHFFVAATRLGGVITGAPTASGGTLYVAVTDAGKPFVVALDQFTGAERWRTVLDTRPGAFTNAAPVVFDGMVFQGFSGDEYVEAARGGYVIMDAADGSVLAKRYTIDDAAFADGYWGGSVWSTPVYDAGTRALYVGTGNPASHDKEHRFTNALVRIDVRPGSDTFGDIVDAYKGTVDQYYPGLDRQPACTTEPHIEYGDAWSLTCVQFDLDFGASPNLFTDARGELVLGALQKSGVYHAVYADTMQLAWTSVVGTPCFVCNAASPAASGGRVFAAGVQPGQVVALDDKTGGYRWASPLADVFHYESVSVANGVVYAPDFYGNLNAFDAETGLPVLKRNMGADLGASMIGVQSGGVAVARNTIYAPALGNIIAYR